MSELIKRLLEHAERHEKLAFAFDMDDDKELVDVLVQAATRIAELSTHPCLTEDGGFDHDWEFVDDSFDHEFGTHIEHYYKCKCCNALKDADGDADESI